jgi:PDZ domain-containing protein
LAFTLTLIDKLSPGDLMGGLPIAVTGTIGINGEVGAIGGLTSKASAVLQSGAKYFLVPTAQGPEDIANARKVVGDKVEIIPVATLDEALAALHRLGGDPAPPDASPTTTAAP